PLSGELRDERDFEQDRWSQLLLSQHSVALCERLLRSVVAHQIQGETAARIEVAGICGQVFTNELHGADVALMGFLLRARHHACRVRKVSPPEVRIGAELDAAFECADGFGKAPLKVE